MYYIYGISGLSLLINSYCIVRLGIAAYWTIEPNSIDSLCYNKSLRCPIGLKIWQFLWRLQQWHNQLLYPLVHAYRVIMVDFVGNYEDRSPNCQITAVHVWITMLVHKNNNHDSIHVDVEILKLKWNLPPIAQLVSTIEADDRPLNPRGQRKLLPVLVMRVP